MKTKFPAMVAGAAFGALVILGATTGQAAAGDYRDGGHRYGGRGDFHWDDRYHGHDRYWGRRDWYGPRWYGPPRYRGPKSGSTFRLRSSIIRLIPSIPLRYRRRSYNSVHASRRSATD